MCPLSPILPPGLDVPMVTNVQLGTRSVRPQRGLILNLTMGSQDLVQGQISHRLLIGSAISRDLDTGL